MENAVFFQKNNSAVLVCKGNVTVVKVIFADLLGKQEHHGSDEVQKKPDIAVKLYVAKAENRKGYHEYQVTAADIEEFIRKESRFHRLALTLDKLSQIAYGYEYEYE